MAAASADTAAPRLAGAVPHPRLGWDFLEDGFDSPMGERRRRLPDLRRRLRAHGLPVVRDARRTRRTSAAVPTPAPVARVTTEVQPGVAEPAPVPRPRPEDDDPAASAMSVAGRLERLATLHASGELTDDGCTPAEQAALREERDT